MLKIFGRQVALFFILTVLVLVMSPKRSRAACNTVCVMKYGVKICASGQCVVWDTDTCYGCSPGGKNYCDDSNYDKTKPNCAVENAGVSKVNGTYYPTCTETCPSCTNYDVVEANMFNGSPTAGPTFDRRICK